MEIKLAGFNVEAEILEQLSPPDNVPLTPETFSAAYARISRSSKDVTALRKAAREDVNKARRSNQRIIFSMGHHSVAEHAVFNFDIIGVSRLALEEIEKFRLVSYTEKSQRYVTLKGDYLLPEEIDDNALKQRFTDTLELQNDFYKNAYQRLKEFIFNKYPEQTRDKAGRKVLEGWAKEDARYILALATQGQVGMTINARNLEHLFRRFALSQRREVREIGRIMYQQILEVAPSVILFPEPSAFEKSMHETAGRFITDLPRTPSPPANTPNQPTILHYTENTDDIALAALIAVANRYDFNDTLQAVGQMPFQQKQELFTELFCTMEFFDSPPREFELPDITFQAIISASNFAQLKRHRMATLLSGDYHIDFGCVVPENIAAVGLENHFKDIIAKTDETYRTLREDYGSAADYILTNSHCRQVVMKMNMREMFHFIRLRADHHAQWDIRALAHNVLEKIKPLMPLTTMMLCGKSEYVSLFEKTYGKKPRFLI